MGDELDSPVGEEFEGFDLEGEVGEVGGDGEFEEEPGPESVIGEEGFGVAGVDEDGAEDEAAGPDDGAAGVEGGWIAAFFCGLGLIVAEFCCCRSDSDFACKEKKLLGLRDQSKRDSSAAQADNFAGAKLGKSVGLLRSEAVTKLAARGVRSKC